MATYTGVGTGRDWERLRSRRTGGGRDGTGADGRTGWAVKARKAREAGLKGGESEGGWLGERGENGTAVTNLISFHVDKCSTKGKRSERAAGTRGSPLLE